MIGSDWDGLKDTITPDVGFRVPTHMPGPNVFRDESYRYQNSHDTYSHYCMLSASMVQIDVPYLAQCMARLITNPDLRKQMGAQGKRRARNVYDWAAIIPQMQDFWADLDDRRTAATQDIDRQYIDMDVPINPNMAALFRSYPSKQGGLNETKLRPTPNASIQALNDVINIRNFKEMGRRLESPKVMEAVLTEFMNQGGAGTPRSVAKALNRSLMSVVRCAYFLLKYDLLRKGE